MSRYSLLQKNSDSQTGVPLDSLLGIDLIGRVQQHHMLDTVSPLEIRLVVSSMCPYIPSLWHSHSSLPTHSMDSGHHTVRHNLNLNQKKPHDINVHVQRQNRE